MTKLDWEKSPNWFVRNRTEIWAAIELIETALDEYDEVCGLAFSDIPEKFECVKDFIDKICFPEFHEEKNENS